MDNWFCSVLNVVCIINVCPVHVGCHRPWTKMHKKYETKELSAMEMSTIQSLAVYVIKKYSTYV